MYIKCSNDCFDETCHNERGICIECGENDKYGDFCNKTCPENYLRNEDNNKRICNRDDGDCYECKDHFTGKKCTKCEEKYYNLSTCEEKCSIYCSEQKYNDITRKCITCISTRYGDFYEMNLKIVQLQVVREKLDIVQNVIIIFIEKVIFVINIQIIVNLVKKGKCENCKEGFKEEKCNLICNLKVFVIKKMENVILVKVIFMENIVI